MRQGQAEESIERSFGELIQRRAGPQVGLVVGKHNVGSRDLLLGLIKTPAQDGQEALLASSSASSANVTAPTNSSSSSSKQGKKKGAGGSGGVGATPQPAVNLTLDTDWVVEHAAQVSRMLPGGLAVLGLYVFCTDPSYQSLLAQLCAVLAAIASQCCQPQGGPGRKCGVVSCGGDWGVGP
ncbi:olfactory receptor 4-like-domain-containing protein [Dunaliella salina]|uniref:Olfactory receptor 4-like-domain-containing protein n=1 Tax=Dunaliella salina TaxID=3046 RepID=A0ABQ7H3U1_DUNSA|nr:olfactory receptor 4-like-domain-containing protein [Dunaliella salina]|eukprot:KAF5841529.1 olfactory receptor 4-like-domain-containing protein [Dunaliella salina]